MSEFNLSEKSWELNEFSYIQDLTPFSPFISVKNVKEFIRLLKEITISCMSGGCNEESVLKRIDKLAGSELI